MTPPDVFRSESYKMGQGPPYSFLRSNLKKPPPPPSAANHSLAGQVALVTGANAGLGLACCDQLLALGLPKLILAARSPPKGEAAAARLRQRHPAADVQVWQVDMLSHASVQAFAARCAALPRLDLAVLNAGLMKQRFDVGPEGCEESFQVNYLSTALLATLLLPTLGRGRSAAGRPGRLTIVSSAAALGAAYPHRGERPYLATFSDAARWDPVEHYPASKGLIHFWLVKVVQSVRPDDVIVNLVDPGLVRGTSLHDGTSRIIQVAFGIIKAALGRTLEVGAGTFIDAAVVKGPESHGCFVKDWNIAS